MLLFAQLYRGVRSAGGRGFLRGLFMLAVGSALCLGGPGVVTVGVAAGLSASNLRCEYLVDPLVIDEAAPRLEWKLSSSEPDEVQSGFQIQVASDAKLLQANAPDLWDTGKVDSKVSSQVVYLGKSLKSRQRCVWRVRVWDGGGKASGWSRPAFWRMGLLADGDWKGEYISHRDSSPVHKDSKKLFLPPAQQYRKEFQAAKGVRSATIYSTALGILELHVNGKRVGDDMFAPGWTDYRQRAYYRAHDVTGLVRAGGNAMGAWVADGWYSGYLGFGLLTGMGTERIGRYTYGKTPAFMAQLEIEYEDGRREVVATDASWKTSGEGPIREADFLMGEYYDARREAPGWTLPGFADAAWEAAIPAGANGSVKALFYEGVNPATGGEPKILGHEVDLGFQRPPKLEAFPGVPVRVIEEIPTREITSPTNGVYIFNLGQNFAGVARLKVKGPAGTVIRIRHGEMLHPDGRLMTENLRKARAIDHYVLRGDPKGETFVPRFTFHGFQFVELSGFPGKPDKDAITGLVLHSDTPMASDFTCSDPMVNRLFKNIVWTQRANFLDLPTDCPQRDERFGWTGDAQIYVRAATYNADVASFYSKWLRELMESQRPSGTFPGFAPHPFQHGWDFGTAWCDAGVICPYAIYQAYGDTRIIERCWASMAKFIEWRKATSKDFTGVVHGNNWGDWLAMGETTPLDYIDTAYFAYSTTLMAEMGAAIGKNREAAEYRALAARVKEAFNRKYVRQDGSLAVDTQTAYALALWMDLLPADLRGPAGKKLAGKIRSKADAKNSGITTGFLGTRPLLPVLSATGDHDLAVSLLQSRKFPSWGFEVENGATTIWERWNSYTREGGFGGEQNASMNSFAHYSFGAVCEWMFGNLAGLRPLEAGWQRFAIQPQPPSTGMRLEGPAKPLDWVRARYESPRGRIESEWRQSEGGFELRVVVPVNTTAVVSVPATGADQVTVDGKPLLKSKRVRFLGVENGFVLMEAHGGGHVFRSRR